MREEEERMRERMRAGERKRRNKKTFSFYFKSTLVILSYHIDEKKKN